MKSRLIICLFLLLAFRGYSQCIQSASISSSAQAICSGSSVTLTAVPQGGTGPYTYVWNTGEKTQSIDVNKAGPYSVTISEPGCPSQPANISIGVAPTPNAPTVSPVTPICSGNSATLAVTPPLSGAYQWYDSSMTLLASNVSTYTTGPLNAPAIFYVTTTEGGCTSAPTPVPVTLTSKPSISGATICAGDVAILSAGNGDTYTWYDANNNVISTTSSYTTPQLFVTTTYYVVVVANGCTSPKLAVKAIVTPPPDPPTVTPNPTVCAGLSANLHADSPLPGAIFNWYQTKTGGTPLISSPDYTTGPINGLTRYYVETQINDCVSSRTEVDVNITQPPPPPADQTVTICYGAQAKLNASAIPGTYKWYDTPNGGNLIFTGNPFTTPNLFGTTKYYVEYNNGCKSSRATITVQVRPALIAPSVAGQIICYNSTATLTPTSAGDSFNWYTTLAGINPIHTGPGSFTTLPLTANTDYYVEAIVGTCISPRAKVTVSVLPQLIAPTPSFTPSCPGSPTTLTASGSADGYVWYDANGILLSQDQVYVTGPVPSGTKFFVAATDGTCTSARSPITVTYLPAPVQPTITGNTNICGGTSTVLTATVPGGGIFEWYDAPTGGNLLYTGSPFSTPSLTTTTDYFVQNNSGNCGSSRTKVTVNVTPVPDPQFQYPSGSFCINSGIVKPVFTNPPGGTFTYTPAIPGLILAINPATGAIDINNSSQGHFVVKYTGTGACARTTTAFIAIGSTTNAVFTYAGSPYCQDSPSPALPTFSGANAGGSFSANSPGLVFLNTSTGEIDLGKSKPGTYTVTNTILASGACTASSDVESVTILQSVTVVAGNNQVIAAGNTAQLKGSIKGSVSTGKWSGGTGTFSNPSDLNAVYTPGPGETSATLTLTSDAPADGCSAHKDQLIVTIINKPAMPTAPGTAVCAGDVANLAATAPAGATFEWYDALTNGNKLFSGPLYQTLPIPASTTFYVQAIIGRVASDRTAVLVTVNPIPAAPIVPSPVVTICTGNTVSITASGSAGTYAWYDAPASGNLLSAGATFTSSNPLVNDASYFVETTVNGCTSPRTQVDVKVTTAPVITSDASGSVCSGVAQNYTIIADIPGTTFSVSRAAVQDINNNQALPPQTLTTIDETLINTSSNPVSVTYMITPSSGTCAGTPFPYVVTVSPAPAVKSSLTATVCNKGAVNYAIAFNPPGGVDFSWSRDAVPGVTNIAVTGQTASTIKEVLFNTTNAPVIVNYVYTYKTSSCAGPTFTLPVTVNPQTIVTSAISGPACTGVAQNYVLTSNVANATYVWNRGPNPNISNPPVFGQTTSTITEALINTSPLPVTVDYSILPSANGCDGTPFKYQAIVNPALQPAKAAANGPVCIGNTIHLTAAPVTNATYLWTGPNGFTSTLQNPDIKNAADVNSGTYFFSFTVNGCSSIPLPLVVEVDQLPTADAGPDQKVCATDPPAQLAGNIGGGASTGNWTTSGTGTFSSSTDLKAQYTASAADKLAGSVVLTLTSTQKSDCNSATDDMTITYGPIPALSAGPDLLVCSQDVNVKPIPKVIVPNTTGTWSTSGTGQFKPSPTDIDAFYYPSAEDHSKGSVTLTLNVDNPGACYIASDDMIVTFSYPPKLNAGGTRYVLKGRQITLTPTVSDENVVYLWSPDVGISDVNVKNPVVTGIVDQTYVLKVTDKLGCYTTDAVNVIVSPEIKVNNTFTPNGDGINDTWEITGLVAYTEATVDIFNRYGTKIFHSVGYPKAWDGTYNGSPVPSGVYYYILDTKMNKQVLSGYVTVVR